MGWHPGGEILNTEQIEACMPSDSLHSDQDTISHRVTSFSKKPYTWEAFLLHNIISNLRRCRHLEGHGFQVSLVPPQDKIRLGHLFFYFIFFNYQLFFP